MKFDKDKVYTAINADELKVGSKVFVADCLDDLQKVVSSPNEDRIHTIVEILSPSNNPRFKAKTRGGGVFYWHFVYLIEEPKSLKWTDLKLGDIICSKSEQKIRMIVGIDSFGSDNHICAGGWWVPDEDLADWEKVED